jgi:undecaprenyl-diphosphatase
MAIGARALSRLGFDRMERREMALLAIGLGACAALLLFVLLAGAVSGGDTLAFDARVLRALRRADDPSRPIGPAWVESALVDLTSLGSSTVLGLVVAIVVGFLVLQRRRRTAIAVALTTISGEIVDEALKHAFNRPRPTIVPHLRQVVSTSFPSGHAMESAIVYLTLGAVLMRVAGSRAVKMYAFAVAAVLTVTVGVTRVWLGVHYPTDVLGGWTIGLVWASICWLATERLETRAGLDAERRESGSDGV